jgi:hypothetical protein
MKNNIKTFISGACLSIVLSLGACQDDIAPIIDTMNLDRLLIPIGLTYSVLNNVDVELNWEKWTNTDAYVVEFSLDSLVYQTIVRTDTVMPNEIPYSVTLEGETQYTARVKSISFEGIADSKWASVVFTTDPE